jgi:hypothetical protein
VRLKRHKRVFLSYSSKDRETVSAIATAYEAAGVQHFFDRTSLKSGEEWSPRLRQEIDRADLFHLCWSKSAADSEWVAKEAEHALTRRRRSNGKKPEITVQMLDGPPWAKAPRQPRQHQFRRFRPRRDRRLRPGRRPVLTAALGASTCRSGLRARSSMVRAGRS